MNTIEPAISITANDPAAAAANVHQPESLKSVDVGRRNAVQ
jgi:hypothetical protein